MGCNNICPSKEEKNFQPFDQSIKSDMNNTAVCFVKSNTNQCSQTSMANIDLAKELSDLKLLKHPSLNQTEILKTIKAKCERIESSVNSSEVKIFDSSNELIYQGGYFESMPHGYGKFACKTSEYEGYFFAGSRHGKGIYKVFTEDRHEQYFYDGDWEIDAKNGQGEERITGVSTYKGSYKQGLKEGHGIIYLDNGSMYEGEFKSNKLHGKGKYCWENGKSYEGEWKDNSIDGLGIFKSSKKIYKGYFLMNKKHGIGISFSLRSEVILVGKWNEDCLTGNFLQYSFSDKNYINEVILRKNIVTGQAERLTKLEMEEYRKSDSYNELIAFFRL